MAPSDRVRESVIKTAALWHGLKTIADPEARFRARMSLRTEWKMRRRERKARIRAAVREYRAENGDERAQALKAGARVIREQASQARIDKELELRERYAARALNPAPQHHLEELEVEK